MELPVKNPHASILIDQWPPYKQILICKYLPTEKELYRRWWRKRLVEFVSKSCKSNNQMHRPRRFSTDNDLFEQYPWIRPLWEAHKVKLNIVKPTPNDVFKRWWAEKKYDFLMRKTRHVYRSKRKRRRWLADIFLYRLFWCPHYSCWAIRLSVLLYTFLICFIINRLYYN